MNLIVKTTTKKMYTFYYSHFQPTGCGPAMGLVERHLEGHKGSVRLLTNGWMIFSFLLT